MMIQWVIDMYKRSDFRQLYYIDKEIKLYKAEMRSIEERGEKSTQALSDMPRAAGVSKKVENSAVDAVEVNEVITYALEKRKREKAKLMRKINSVEDAEMRLILLYRYVYCFSWERVAAELNSTSDAVRSKDKRFFEGKIK